MEETFDKEVLTTWSIQQLYRKDARGCLLSLPFVAVILGLLLLFNFTVEIGGILWLYIAVFGLLFLILLVASIGALIVSFRPPIMVVATRVKPVGMKETFHRGYRQGRGYILYFHGYGKIELPRYMYEYLEMGTLSDEELWRCTFPGDKFYLLLNRSGHIIYCFPCNNFEYVGELTPNKYER